ncbi:MAG: glucose 1-dehydrogenase [Alphaproteobacteria bacterium]|nr:glucose 1-dehydrogenase [Alphaproteobacteria bacterium]
MSTPATTGRIAGKTAIVTGAARGIGAAIAARFAAEGARVLLTDLNEAEGEARAGAIRQAGGTARFLAQDVAVEAGWTRVVQAAEAEFGPIDILVNNAGLFLARPLPESTLEDLHRLCAVNIDGVFLGTRAAMDCARRRPTDGPRLSVINLSSVAGLKGASNTSIYSLTKGAVRLFTKAVALECASAGLPMRVNSVHPGVMDTEMAREVMQKLVDDGLVTSPGEARDFIALRHPLKRMGTAEDVAATALFLASEESSFYTGAELVVDGGFTL